MKTKLLKLVQNLLVAQRNNNLIKSDAAYHKLLSFCQTHNIDFNNALEGATKILRTQPANIMQGIGAA